MAQLQDEVLKLLEESEINETQENLQEATFKDILTAANNVKTDEFEEYVGKFNKVCEEALKSIGESVKKIRETEKQFNEVKNLRDRNNNKSKLISDLKSSYSLMELAERDIKMAKSLSRNVNEELDKVASSIKEVKFHLYNKNAWFHRVFRFWK